MTEISVLNTDDDNNLLKPPKSGVEKFFDPPVKGPSTAWGPSSPESQKFSKHLRIDTDNTSQRSVKRR